MASKYGELLARHPGLGGAMHALAAREGSLIDELRVAETSADPDQIDARLRAIIRKAQEARRLLRSGAEL